MIIDPTGPIGRGVDEYRKYRATKKAEKLDRIEPLKQLEDEVKRWIFKSEKAYCKSDSTGLSDQARKLIDAMDELHAIHEDRLSAKVVGPMNYLDLFLSRVRDNDRRGAIPPNDTDFWSPVRNSWKHAKDLRDILAKKQREIVDGKHKKKKD